MLGAVGTGGCDAVSNLAGDWGENSKDKDDVSAIKPGMNSSDVVVKIGKAHKMVEGDLVYSGWQEWVYPTGSLVLYRGVVRQVNVKPLTSSQLAVLKNPDKKYDLNLNILEGDKNETAVAKEETSQANDIWPEDNFIPAKPKITSGLTTGFMQNAEDIKPEK